MLGGFVEGLFCALGGGLFASSGMCLVLFEICLLSSLFQPLSLSFSRWFSEGVSDVLFQLFLGCCQLL